MRSNATFICATTVATLFACASLITGCATQELDLSHIKQGDPMSKQANLEHFKESGTSIYMLLDLINVSPITMDDLMASANPENRPVVNLQVSSEEDFWGFLLNMLNGGIVDRGVFISLNKVTIEGDIVHP